MNGTTLDTTVVRVVDGDTVRVNIDQGEESLRILSLDTEESFPGGSKPQTPLGHAAKAEAMDFFKPGDDIKLEFPGNEALDVCLQKYRGNFGRLLVYIYRPDGTDFQEHMIQAGFSPYFVKYGYSQFQENHRRYIEAEREAQIGIKGVWDQIANNGSEINNYALLGTWWTLRAEVIDGYRRFKAQNPPEPVFNTRLDYATLLAMAQSGTEATIFTELRNIRMVGSTHAVIGIGSSDKPFDIFIPRIDLVPGKEVLDLVTTRYISSGLDHPRKGYAYIRGQLKMFKQRPEILVLKATQVSDFPTGIPLP